MIAAVLNDTNNISEFYLHWNQINSKGGYEIIGSLIDNPMLKTFDLSFNNIGDDKYIIQALSTLFKKNKTLIHFDISSNGFTDSEC